MTDAQLRQDVLEQLEFKPSIAVAHIGVTAEKGMVALTGHVANYSQGIAAVTAVRRVKGVRGIVDEIEVRYLSSAKTSDNEVAQRALMMLDRDIAVPPNAASDVRSKGKGVRH